MGLNLDIRRQKFVDEILVDGCGTAAAIRAGVPPAGAHVWASRALKNPKVSATIQARQAADAERLKLDRQAVLEGLLTAIELARERGDPGAMIRGWTEVGRLLGFYAPEVRKVDLSIAAKRVIERLETLTDAELLAIVEAGEA